MVLVLVLVVSLSGFATGCLVTDPQVSDVLLKNNANIKSEKMTTVAGDMVPVPYVSCCRYTLNMSAPPSPPKVVVQYSGSVVGKCVELVTTLTPILLGEQPVGGYAHLDPLSLYTCDPVPIYNPDCNMLPLSPPPPMTPSPPPRHPPSPPSTPPTPPPMPPPSPAHP